MADEDDPFGLLNDAGRTRIRPLQPGPTTPPSYPGSVPVSFAPAPRLRDNRSSDNPLINAFAPLLSLAPELERATAPENPDAMRARLLDNLTAARDEADAAGAARARADQAAWFVAALLDDIAINTPWGGSSGWPRQALVVSLYGDVDAGTRYFDHLDALMRAPDRDPDLLELAYVTTALGFRGKYRVEGAAGEAELMQLRSRMARLLRDREALDQPLSPNWEGVEAEDEDRGFIVPIWAIVLIAIALIAGSYVGLSIRLTNRGEQLYALAGVLPPPERAEIFRPVIESDPVSGSPIIPFVLELLPLFTEAAPQGTQAALSGAEDASTAKLIVQGAAPEVFRSAKADVNGEYRALFDSIAAVIVENSDFIGGVTVVGHTDSVPVQSSNPFRSNQGLSEARAKTVADLLIAAGVPAGLVTSMGRAASEPIGDNATRDGRARNRRVEIILQKKV